MPLIPYNPDNSLSRYDSQKNWAKVLFRSDRKLQTTEIEEIQDLLLGQINQAFDTLYDFYTVITGCKIIVQGITSTAYQCILADGQVYVDYLNITGAFVDVPSLNFVAQRDEKTTVGVRFSLDVDTDNPLNNNPSTGGPAFGSPGADRLVLKATPVVDSDSAPITKDYYPIAIIKPKSPNFIANHPDVGDGYPDVYYYRNEELTKVFNEEALTGDIRRMMERTIHEMAGDFINEGYHLSFNERSRILSASPGNAYINGKRIEHNYINGVVLNFDDATAPTPVEEDLIYLAYITSKGEFGVSTFPIDTPYVPDPPSEALALGTLRWEGYGAFQRGEPTYSIVEARNRMPSVQELILLQQEHEENKKELVDLALTIEILTAGNSANTQLNGLVADSFNDLNKTDVSNPLFAASIMPTIQAMGLPFISFPKNHRTFIITPEDNTGIRVAKKINDLNEEVFYWYTVAGNEQKVIYQERSSNFELTTAQQGDTDTLELLGKKIRLGGFVPSTGDTSLTAFTSPNLVYRSDQATIVNYTAPKMIGLISNQVNSQVLVNNQLVNVPFSTDTLLLRSPGRNNLIQSQRIIVEASGFPAFQDNISLYLNDALLGDVTFLDGVGTAGSNFGTARSSISGKLKFSFELPNRTDREVFSLRMVSGVYEATSEISIADPEGLRLIRELSGRYVVSVPSRYSLTPSQVLQTFLIDAPMMLSSVELRVNLDSVTGNIPLDADILTVYITEMLTADTPSDETLGVATLYRPQIGSDNWAKISFDRPIIISDTGKTYGIVVNSSIENIELANYDAAAINQQDGTAGTGGQRVEGSLFLRNSEGRWEPELSRDLTFRLNRHVPSTIASQANITVRNTEAFNVIDINIAAEIKDSGQIRIEVEDRGQFVPVPNGVYFFDDEITETSVRIFTIGTENTHPIIDLDDVSINLISYRSSGIWTSINYEFETGYTTMELSFEAFNPANATFEVYISSDKGLTWEEITEIDSSGAQQYLVSEEISNALVPLTKYTYLKNDFTQYIQLGGVDIERKNLIVRVDMRVTDKTNLPFFKNLTALTY